MTVRKLVYEGAAYAPSAEGALINLDHVVHVTPVKTRRNEPCVEIHFVNAPPVHCVGVPEDFLREGGK